MAPFAWCKAVFLGSVQHYRKASLIIQSIKMIFSGNKVSPVVQSSSPVQWIETPALEYANSSSRLEEIYNGQPPTPPRWLLTAFLFLILPSLQSHSEQANEIAVHQIKIVSLAHPRKHSIVTRPFQHSNITFIFSVRNAQKYLTKQHMHLQLYAGVNKQPSLCHY